MRQKTAFSLIFSRTKALRLDTLFFEELYGKLFLNDGGWDIKGQAEKRHGYCSLFRRVSKLLSWQNDYFI